MTVSTTNVFSKWRMLWHFFVSRLSIPGRQETGTHLEKSVQYWNWRLSRICCCCCHFESAVVIPANQILICTQGEVCCIISKALKPIRGRNDTGISDAHHCLLHSVWMCPLHYEWLTQQEVPKLPTHTYTDTKFCYGSILHYRQGSPYLVLNTFYRVSLTLLLHTKSNKLDSLWLSGGTVPSSETEITRTQHTSHDSTSQ